MISSETSQIPMSEHFEELYKIIKISALAIIISSFIMSFFIDEFMNYWISALDLGNKSLELSIYSPYDWINIKWAILLIFSITMVLPITSIKLRNFALPGLYPNE
jgi:Sec-independent protein secretion pathway component TatC